MTGHEFRKLSPRAVDMVWERVAPMIDVASKRSAGLALDEIKARLAAGSMQLWLLKTAPGITGALVTEVFETAKGRTFGLTVISGRGLATWWPLIDTLNAEAKRLGCIRMEGIGRDGWREALKHRDWTRIATVFERKVT